MLRATLAVAFLAGLVVQVRAQQEIIERMMAVVEGEIITQSDVDAAIALGLVPTVQAHDPREAALQALIERLLTLREVRRYVPLEPDADTVDARVQMIRERFASAESWAQALERAGLNEGRLRELVRDELRIQAYVDERFPSSPPPTEDEVTAYYQEHESDFVGEGRVLPLTEVREVIRQRLRQDRRDQMIANWLSGLERRADIRVLYPSGSPTP